MPTYKKVDIETWHRKVHYSIFKDYLQPQYSISFELDITNFYKKIKENKWSFTFALIYAITKCANEIEEFRYRFEDGEVVLYEDLNVSFTYLNKETELLKNVVVEMDEDIQKFIDRATEVEKNQKEYFTGPMGNEIYQFSAIPWISFTHISHTDLGKKYNAVPMFDWGKFFERDGKMILPFSVQAHHSFVDGIHMGKLAQKLQSYLDQF
nr:chloramphenicol acetyltransferase [uncultured Cellulosilyticum sp.]